MAIMAHMPKIELKLHPAFFIPAVLDKPSGILEINMATTVAMLTAPPVIMVNPIAMDSGIPSITEPTAIAMLLLSDDSDFNCSPERLRCLAP